MQEADQGAAACHVGSTVALDLCGPGWSGSVQCLASGLLRLRPVRLCAAPVNYPAETPPSSPAASIDLVGTGDLRCWRFAVPEGRAAAVVHE